MRILHILEATLGGTRRHILDLLPALRVRGIDCDLIYSLTRNPQFAGDAACLRDFGVGVFPVPMARGWGGRSDAAAWRALGTHLRLHHYDVIHCHSTKAGLLGRLPQPVPAALRTPVVYTPHCVAFDTSLPVRSRRAARLVERLLAPRTAHFIAVSRHERRVLRHAALCGSDRVTVITNGIDLPRFDALPRLVRAASPSEEHRKDSAGSVAAGRLGLHSDDFVIGCFGRLTRQKHQAALVRALPAVMQAVPHARLLLVGGGEDEAALRALARQCRVAERIVWTGEVTEARPYYALCDVVAQPSRWEGCPYSVLEAMAARRAVVATAVGGIPELLGTCPSTGESGGTLYCPPRESVLAERIIGLAADDAARRQLGRSARRRVEDCFSMDQMVEKTLAVYQRV